MSKIFYDHLIILEQVEMEIKNISNSPEEKEELWSLVDDIVQHRVIIKILDHLPAEHHHEFLTGFHHAPHHASHIGFLRDRIEHDVEELIKEEVKLLEGELLREIKSLKRKM